MTQSTDRPNPLGSAATKIAAIVAPIGGILSALVAYGVLTQAQADATYGLLEGASPTVTALGVIVAGVAPMVSAVIAAFGTSTAAKPAVTPASDPRELDEYGNLVKLTKENR